MPVKVDPMLLKLRKTYLPEFKGALCETTAKFEGCGKVSLKRKTTASRVGQ